MSENNDNILTWVRAESPHAFSTHRAHTWTTSCGKFRVTRLEVGEGGYTEFAACHLLEDGTWWPCYSKPEGVTYCKTYRTLARAFEEAERYVREGLGLAKLTSNLEEVLAEAEGLGLAEEKHPEKKTKLVSRPGYNMMETRGGITKEGGTTMSFKRDEVVGLLKELGFATAEKKTDEQLVGWLYELPAQLSDAERGKVESEAGRSLLADIEDHIFKGEDIMIASEEHETEQAPAKKHAGNGKAGTGKDTKKMPTVKVPGGKSKKTAADDGGGGGTATAAKTRTKKQVATPGAKRGPGVYSTIIECLQKASRKRPVTREAILEVLKERFPDREPASMKTTVAGVPSWFRLKYGLNVQGDKEKGFWAE